MGSNLSLQQVRDDQLCLCLGVTEGIHPSKIEICSFGIEALHTGLAAHTHNTF